MRATNALVRSFGELLWYLRRGGFSFAIPKVLDAYRAIALVGFESKSTLRDALAITLLSAREERERFNAVFDAYFERSAHDSIWQKLVAIGFTANERGEIKNQFTLGGPGGETSTTFATVLEGGAEFARWMQLGVFGRALELRSLAQLGSVSERAYDAVGVSTAIDVLSEVGRFLRDRFGEKGKLAEELFRQEILSRKKEIRETLRASAQEVEDRETMAMAAESKNFAELDAAEYEKMRRAVGLLAQKLRGGELVRRRKAHSGKIDAHRTVRAALRTGGVPFRLVRIRKKRERSKLILLCDISDSVKAAAAFMLEFVSATHDLFERVRSFVFVSEIGETTRLFELSPRGVALARAFSGEIVPVTENSNYGLALSRFYSRMKKSLDRRTTVVILGDGRSNYADAGIEVLSSIRSHVKRVVWICPERKRHWGRADSAILRMAPHCDEMLEAACASDLEAAMRRVVARPTV